MPYPPADDRLRHLLAQRINCHVDTWQLAFFIADALTTPVVEYAVATDDAPSTPATTCSAQHHGVGLPRMCIRAAQHEHPRHTDEHGFNWSDTVAVYPVGSADVKSSLSFPRPAELIEDERALREYEAAALHRHGLIRDSELNAVLATSDTQRTTRLASIRNLLDRAGRGVLIGGTEGELLRQQVEAELRLSDQLRAGRATWKTKAEEIERDRDNFAEELTREQAAAERQRERARIAETELRVLRAGLRANGADPTQIQNLWAQIRLRNRQWREAKRETALTRSMLEAEGGDVALVDEMIATVAKAEGEAREAQDAIERVRTLRDPIADALENADYRPDMRRGDLADAVMPVILAALDGTGQPIKEQQ